MALSIPSYPNPFDPAHPLLNAYAWNAHLALDAATGSGRVVLFIHPSEAAYAALPVDRLSVALGEILVPANATATPPVAEVRMVTLADLMGDPEVAAAINTIGVKLYTVLAERHPALAGATPA